MEWTRTMNRFGRRASRRPASTKAFQQVSRPCKVSHSPTNRLVSFQFLGSFFCYRASTFLSGSQTFDSVTRLSCERCVVAQHGEMSNAAHIVTLETPTSQAVDTTPYSCPPFSSHCCLHHWCAGSDRKKRSARNLTRNSDNAAYESSLLPFHLFGRQSSHPASTCWTTTLTHFRDEIQVPASACSST